MHFLDYLLSLYKKKSQIKLLTIVYAAISIVVVILAGLIALVDQSAGVALLIIPIIAITALCMNLIAWSITKSTLDSLCIHFKKKTLNLAIKEPKKRDDAAEKREVDKIEAKISKKTSKSKTA